MSVIENQPKDEVMQWHSLDIKDVIGLLENKSASWAASGGGRAAIGSLRS